MDQSDTDIEIHYRQTYEYYAYRLMCVSIERLIRTKAILLKQYSLPPHEIDHMQYWEYEMLIKCLGELNDEEKREYENSEKKSTIPKTFPSIQYPSIPKEYKSIR